jgi:hypothetical protein
VQHACVFTDVDNTTGPSDTQNIGTNSKRSSKALPY